MKVFISWSGDKSREVALALADWLPQVINSVEPFVSAQDIAAGSRWQAEVSSELEATNFGIVCVTAENQLAPWLNFEAGGLAKAVDESRVVPLAIDLSPADIKLPLGQFQAQPATAAGLRAIALSLNATSDQPLVEGRLDKALKKWWPDLDQALERIEERSASPTADAPQRSDRELLEEILNTVRSFARPAASGWDTSWDSDTVDQGVLDDLLVFARQLDPSLSVRQTGVPGAVFVIARDGSLSPGVQEQIREFGLTHGVGVLLRRIMKDGSLVPID